MMESERFGEFIARVRPITEMSAENPLECGVLVEDKRWGGTKPRTGAVKIAMQVPIFGFSHLESNMLRSVCRTRRRSKG
jgi:hypothetical protein